MLLEAVELCKGGSEVKGVRGHAVGDHLFGYDVYDAPDAMDVSEFHLVPVSAFGGFAVFLILESNMGVQLYGCVVGADLRIQHGGGKSEMAPRNILCRAGVAVVCRHVFKAADMFAQLGHREGFPVQTEALLSADSCMVSISWVRSRSLWQRSRHRGKEKHRYIGQGSKQMTF